MHATRHDYVLRHYVICHRVGYTPTPPGMGIYNRYYIYAGTDGKSKIPRTSKVKILSGLFILM